MMSGGRSMLPPAGKPGLRLRRQAAVAGLALLITGSVAVQAGQFAVHPLRLEMGATARSSAITVRNDDPGPLAFQVRGMRWTQDDHGQDHYEAATDLIYFPRLLTLAPGQEGVIRVGVRHSLVPLEKAYRLFIEELAQPAAPSSTSPAAGPQIRLLVRFAAPIFIQPASPRRQLELEPLHMVAGQVRWKLRNGGNRHERLQGVTLQGLNAQGTPVFSSELEDRYVLAGKTRPFAWPMPAPWCLQVTRLLLDIRTEDSRLEQSLDISQPACP